MIKRIFFRLLIVTIFIVGLGTARNVLVQSAICGYSKSKLSFPLAMKSAQLEPFRGKLHLHEIQLPDIPLDDSEPGDMEKISATVDSISVTMDTDKLLRRYFHFDQVNFHGIHAKLELRNDFGASKIFVPREIRNRFQTQFPDWVARDESLPDDSLVHALVPLLTGRFDQNAREQLQRQFESPKFSRDAAQRWNDELQPFMKRIRDFSAKVERIQGVMRNPRQFSQAASSQELASTVQDVLRDAESLEIDLRYMISQKDTFKSDAQKDALTLKQVLRNDYDKLRNLRPPKIEPGQIAELLLGNEIQHRLESILAWVHSLDTLLEQEFLPENLEPFPLGRSGKNIVFKSRENQTHLRARQIDFDGDLLIENQPVYFLGRIHDASLPAGTVTIQLCLDFNPIKITTPQDRDAILSNANFHESAHTIPQDMNSSRVYVAAVVDTQGDTANNRIISQRYCIVCSGFQIPERTIGISKEFPLVISPGISRFYATLDRSGDEIKGRVHLTQSQVQLTAENRPEIQHLLSQLTHDVNGIDMEMSFSGTKNRPEFRIKSDFNHRIAENFDAMIAQNWNRMRQSMANELNSQTNQTLRQLGGMFNEELDATFNKLLIAKSEIVGGNSNATVSQVVQSLLRTSPQQGSPLQPYASQFIEQMTPQQQNTLPLKNIEQELKKELYNGINRFFNQP